MNNFSLRSSLLCALCVSGLASAANNPSAEYDKKIRDSQNVGTLGDGLAGDSINFYTGAGSFHTTDISVPTNGLPLTLGRTFQVAWGTQVASKNGSINPDIPEIISDQLHSFGGWDLDVPSISTTMTQSKGWALNSTIPTKRCSVIGQTTEWGGTATGAPPTVNGSRGWFFDASQYWSGYSLNVPGSSRSLLLASQPNIPKPDTTKAYHWTTNDGWWVSCLTSTQHSPAGEAVGEGFLAIAPDGTQYTFDWLSKRNINSLMIFTPPEAMGGMRDTYLHRADYFMLATKVEDRFGNWIKYNWSNDDFARLISITAGVKNSAVVQQSITVHYDTHDHIDWATDGTRTWHYQYIGNYDLSKVILPDNSFWQYGMGALDEGPGGPVCDIDLEFETNTDYYYWYCWGGGEVPDAPYQATVVHPSGAIVNFLFENHFQFSRSQPATYTLGLTSKTISGPGLASATWKFNHMLSKAEIKAKAQALQDPNWLVTDQINPDSSIIRRAYGLVANQAMLVGEFQGSLTPNGGGSPAITASTAAWGAEALSHAAPGAGVVPVFYRELQYTYPVDGEFPSYNARVGVDPLGTMNSFAQTYASERRLPMRVSTLKQQNVVFGTTSTAFDNFARPTTTTRSSSGNAGGNFTRTDKMTYQDDLQKWVIGLPLTVKNATGTEVISETQYDAALLPVAHYRFGVLQETLGYNADGTLAWVMDGNNRKTLISQWYRGVPKKIIFADASTKEATVNVAGDILTTMDELESVTSYGYDGLGRLGSIAYPTDGVSWNSLTRAFTPVAGIEHGLPGGHWKQTVKTGNGWNTTFYDGRWNPVLTLSEVAGDLTTQSFVVRRFDNMGRETFSSYPLSSADLNNTQQLKGVTTEYDALGRPVKVKQDGDGTQVLETKTEYLATFQTRVTLPRSASTTITTKYQVFGAPNTDAPMSIAAPEGVNTVFTRDDYGNPLSVTRSGPGG